MSDNTKKMTAVGQKDTDIEVMVRKRLWEKGLRYRKNVDDVPGKPDICHKGKNIAIFIDGCFWHGCSKCDEMPKSNQEFWKKKIQYNQSRREDVKKQLEKEDWEVLEVWGHEIRDNVENVINKIEKLWENRAST